jgi:hypothetical protein
VLQRAGPRVADQPSQIDAQECGSARDRYVRTDLFTHLDLDAEFLVALADQRIHVAFPGFRLAAGKLPSAGHFGWVGAFAGEHTTIHDDGRTDDHAGAGPF